MEESGDTADHMSCQELSSSAPVTSSVLDILVSRFSHVLLHKLTNVDFWVQHLDSIFSDAGIMVQAAQEGWSHPDQCQSLVQQFLQILNSHLAHRCGSDTNNEVKNFFPKLGDLLIQRVSKLFGDYLTTGDIGNTATVTNSSIIDTSTDEQNDEIIKRCSPALVNFAEKLGHQNHGRHRVEMITDKQGHDLVRCDGYNFKFKTKSDLLNGNCLLKCTFRGCRAFIRIKNKKIVGYPSRASHLNHPIPKTLKLLKESWDY